ncbi:uncharacterized protein TrAFT101_000545 [Trichoderma asperellum]|uniref:uncharacterized protein n=1 Tax=Trichoderma asperellum TaxID=101201 RepID=UPI003326DE1F|nr:hypothetical protein TrAFT101_000545 [Trichoderma asperellum]
MPVTTILQHAIQRELPVKAEAASNAHNGKNEGSLISGHIPVEANLNTAESSSPQKYRASKVKRAAPAISSGSSRHPKQPRNASASRRRRKSRPSSTQIASESGHYTFVSEIFPSLEPISLGASFFIPFGMANGTATYEQSPKGTWEPQLNYCHTPPASSTNCTNEKAFPSAYTAAEDMLNPLNSHSTTASPSTNQRSSGQRSSFASSSEPISPSSYFTAQSCPRGYKNAQTSIEDNNTTGAGNEPVSDTNPQETSCLQHINQQAVESLREEEEEEEEEEAVHHVAASRLAEIPQPAIIKQAVPTIEQVPPAQAKVAAQEKVNSKQITSPQPRRTLRSSSAPYPGMSPQSASPEVTTKTRPRPLLSDNQQLVTLAQPSMMTRSKSRSSQPATARQRARNQRRQRAASQSAASSRPTENSLRSRRATTRQPTGTAQSPVAASSQAVVSSASVVPSQAVTSSQDVPFQEDAPHGTTVLQQARQRRLAPRATEATRHLLASQSVATPYSAISSQHVSSQSVYSNSLTSQYPYQQDGYSPALVGVQSAYPQSPQTQHLPDCPNNPYTREPAATQMPMDEAEFFRNGGGPSQVTIGLIPYAQGGASMLDMQSGEGNTMMDYLMHQDPVSLTAIQVSNGTPELYAGVLQQQAQRIQAAYPYGLASYPMMNPGYAHSDAGPPDAHYNTPYAAPMQDSDMQSFANQMNDALALQQPQNMSAPNYPSHPDVLASHNGVHSQSFPILHSQRPDNELYMSYAHQASIHGPHLQNSFHQGVQGTSWQDEQAIIRGSLGDQSDIQEVSREVWQEANRMNMGRKAMSRARSMAPPLQQNAPQRLGSFMAAPSQQVSRVSGQTAGYVATLPRTQHPIFERRALVNSQAPVTPREALSSSPTLVASEASPALVTVSTARTGATSRTTATLGAPAASRTPLPNAPRGGILSRPRNGPSYGGIQRHTPPQGHQSQARCNRTQQLRAQTQTREPVPTQQGESQTQVQAQALVPARVPAQAPATEPSVQPQELASQLEESPVHSQAEEPFVQTGESQAQAQAATSDASVQAQAPNTVQAQESPSQIQEQSVQVQAQAQEQPVQVQPREQCVQIQPREQSIQPQAQAQAQGQSSQVQEQHILAQYPSVRVQKQGTETQTPQSPVESHRLPLPTAESLCQAHQPRATLVPPPYRLLEESYQIQQPVLVEDREARSTEEGPADETE